MASKFLQKLQSFVSPVVIHTASSEHNPYLELAYEDGKLVLNTEHANYSYGGLQQAFAECFEEINLGERLCRNALVLGLGAGGLVRHIHAAHPTCHVVGVEQDAVVLELARTHFDLAEQPNLRVVHAEAATYLAQETIQYDLVVVDVFQDVVVPAAVETPAFIAHLHRVLQTGGTLVYNRLLEPAANRAATEALEPILTQHFPRLQRFHTLDNRFWIARRVVELV